jgi:hypothetical protein
VLYQGCTTLVTKAADAIEHRHFLKRIRGTNVMRPFFRRPNLIDYRIHKCTPINWSCSEENLIKSKTRPGQHVTDSCGRVRMLRRYVHRILTHRFNHITVVYGTIYYNYMSVVFIIIIIIIIIIIFITFIY